MTNSTEISTTDRQKYIERAAAVKNPMETLTDAAHYSATSADGVSNNSAVTLYCRKKSDMDAKTLKWAFKLAERNVGPFYKKLELGWQPKVKQNDLNKNWARYLVATDKSGAPVAFAMFRFDMDYSQCVLYCYEMQIEPAYHRKGLGKHMMHTLECCAQYWHMEKVILTVLKNNAAAMSFFRAIGYTVDSSSPGITEKAEYEILSKTPAPLSNKAIK